MHHVPLRLAHIVGQPPVRHLAAYVEQVRTATARSRCFALAGPMGTGKTESAEATARELGCKPPDENWAGGLTIEDCSQFGVDRCDELFRHELCLSVDTPYRWRCVILEEFERVSPACQVKLKFYLSEQRIPPRLCLIATSNSLVSIDKAILSRFKVMPYGNGATFADACRKRLEQLWASQAGGEMPCGWTVWGRDNEGGFDMRSALASFEEALAERQLLAA